MSYKFGIRTDGLEQAFEKTIKELISFHSEFTLFEIGTADGESLSSFSKIVKENIGDKNWSVVGTDLEDGWSYHQEKVLANFNNNIEIVKYNDFLNAETNKNYLVLGNARDLLHNKWNKKIHFGFIDGCHGKQCVINDFLAIERHIAKNGVVAFHDCGLLEQGTDFQPHCEEPINVRQGIIELGLPYYRYGWRFVTEVQGTRNWGGDGNNLMLFQKVV